MLSLWDEVVLLAASAVDAVAFATRFGDPDMVVALVVAVVGRSSETRDMAAPELAGSLPVISRRCILDLRSSSSSHTVDGAAVDAVDSVPSMA